MNTIKKYVILGMLLSLASPVVLIGAMSLDKEEKKVAAAAIVDWQEALFDAVRRDSIADAKVAIANGADVNKRNKEQTELPLFCAKSVAMAKFLLSQGAEVAGENSSEQNALFFAATADMVSFLAEQGLDVNKTDDRSRTPLHTAKTVEVAQEFIKQGLSVDQHDGYGEIPLFYAQTGEMVNFLIDENPDKNSVNARDGSQRTPLFYAAYNGRVEAVKALLERRALLEAEDRKGEHPLWAACSRYIQPGKKRSDNPKVEAAGEAEKFDRIMEAIELLLAAGASPNISKGELGERKYLFNELTPVPRHLSTEKRDWEDTKIRHREAAERKKRLIARLVRGGAFIHDVDRIAIPEMKQLIEQAKDERAWLQTWEGRTADIDPLLQEALHGADIGDVVKGYLAHACEVQDARNWALFDVVRRDDVQAVERLLRSGVDANIKDCYVGKKTPLFFAKSVKMVRLLIKYGADVNIQDQDRTTLLHCAANADVAQELLNHGAKAKLETKNKANGTALSDMCRMYCIKSQGRNPATSAEPLRIKGIIDVLLCAGADVNVVGYKGTPLQYALEHVAGFWDEAQSAEWGRQFIECIKLLITTLIKAGAEVPADLEHRVSKQEIKDVIAQAKSQAGPSVAAAAEEQPQQPEVEEDVAVLKQVEEPAGPGPEQEEDDEKERESEAGVASAFAIQQRPVSSRRRRVVTEDVVRGPVNPLRAGMVQGREVAGVTHAAAQRRRIVRAQVPTPKEHGARLINQLELDAINLVNDLQDQDISREHLEAIDRELSELQSITRELTQEPLFGALSENDKAKARSLAREFATMQAQVQGKLGRLGR